MFAKPVGNPVPQWHPFWTVPKFFNDILGRLIAATQKPEKMVIGSRTEIEKTLLWLPSEDIIKII